MIVGNDIVDRATAGVPSERFEARVLAPDELALVRRSVDRASVVWRLWAAKEAAYKILAREDPELPFAHRRFRVDLDAAVVHHERGQVPVRWAEHGAALACWGWSGSGVVVCRSVSVEQVEAEAEAEAAGAALTGSETTVDRHSRAARLVARWLVGQVLGVDPASVAIVRPERRGDRGHEGRLRIGPPEVWLGGRPHAGLAVSLAHDGRFVSAAIATARWAGY